MDSRKKILTSYEQKTNDCQCKLDIRHLLLKPKIVNKQILNVGGAIHFIYYINRLTATKADSNYLSCLTINAQRICLWQGSNA